METCPYCGEDFKTLTELHKHALNVHTDQYILDVHDLWKAGKEKLREEKETRKE